jgi:hypothetical protein
MVGVSPDMSSKTGALTLSMSLSMGFCVTDVIGLCTLNNNADGIICAYPFHLGNNDTIRLRLLEEPYRLRCC